MGRVFKIFLTDLVRNRVMLGFTALLFLITAGLFSMESRPEKAFSSVVTVVILLVPVMSLLFSSIYYYGSRDFLTMLLASPMKRSSILVGLWSALSVILVLTFLVGIAVPVLLFYRELPAFYLIAAGVLLNIVFTSFGLLVAGSFNNRLSGLGTVLAVWLFFALIYDGVLLYVLYSFREYPLEKLMPYFIGLNPIDLARVLVLIQTDAAALLGYTGAVFKQLAGDVQGSLIAFAVLFVWAFLPLPFMVRLFNKKDF